MLPCCCDDGPGSGGPYCQSPCQASFGRAYVPVFDPYPSGTYGVEDYPRLAEFSDAIPPIPPWAGSSAGCFFGRAHAPAGTYNGGDSPGKMIYSSRMLHRRPHTFTTSAKFSLIFFLTPYTNPPPVIGILYPDRISGGSHIYTSNTRAIPGGVQVSPRSLNPVTLVSGEGYCLVEDLQTTFASGPTERDFKLRFECGRFDPVLRGFYGSGGQPAPSGISELSIPHASRSRIAFQGFGWPGFDLEITFEITTQCEPSFFRTTTMITWEGFDLLVNPEYTSLADYWIKRPRSGYLTNVFDVTPTCPQPCYGHTLGAVNDSPTSWAYATDSRYNGLTGLWTVNGTSYDVTAQRLDYLRAVRV